jgi:hypothetical protein
MQMEKKDIRALSKEQLRQFFVTNMNGYGKNAL